LSEAKPGAALKNSLPSRISLSLNPGYNAEKMGCGVISAFTRVFDALSRQ